MKYCHEDFISLGYSLGFHLLVSFLFNPTPVCRYKDDKIRNHRYGMYGIRYDHDFLEGHREVLESNGFHYPFSEKLIIIH